MNAMTLRAVQGEVVGGGVWLEPNPFKLSTMRFIEMPDGFTLAEAVDAAAKRLPPPYRKHLRVWLGEDEIAPALWSRVRPKPAAHVYVRVRPQGRGAKNILRAVLIIAAIAAAVYFLGPAAGVWASIGLTGAGAAAASAAAIAAVGMVATLAINALIPPPKPDGANGKNDPRFQLTSTNNRLLPYAPIPRLFGKIKVYPVHAARPFTENHGKHQYLRMLLLVGWGPIRVTDIRIGNSPISLFKNVEVEITEGGAAGWGGNVPITLYNRKVTEQSLSFQLTTGVPAAFQTTDFNTVEIAVDITFPFGLIEFQDDGDIDSVTAYHKVEYRVAGSGGAWLTPTLESNGTEGGSAQSGGILKSTEKTSEGVRHTARFKVASGRYEVRVTRTDNVLQDNPPDDDHYADRSFWTVLRSFSTDAAVVQDNICMIAIRMQASEQLNGMPDQISCIAESYLPVYNGSTWSYQITSNPAWAYADLFRRRAGLTHMADSRLDLSTIMAWATACDVTAPNASEPMWTYNGMIEGGSIFEAARQIASIGRASYTMKDGKHSVVRDVTQSTPVQHITPANSWGYSGTRSYPDLPHGLRIQFANKDQDYQVDERIAYADGYDENNATRFEVLELFGATSPTMVWREGRYHIAVGQLRPEEHRVTMDIENLRCTLGDRVQLSHDVISVGKAFGRIAALNVSGPNTIGFTLDGKVEFENDTTYQLRTREANGDTSIRTVTPGGGTQNLVQRSEEIGNAYWTKENASITSDAANAPDGSATADKLIGNTSAARHDFYGANMATGSGYTVSIYAKAVEKSFLAVGMSNVAGLWTVAQFNLATGKLDNLYAQGGLEVVAAEIYAADDGYYHCVVHVPQSAVDGGAQWPVFMVGNGGNPISENVAHNGTDGLLVWGAQAQALMPIPGDPYYVKTVSAAAYGGWTETLLCSAETTAGGAAAGDLFMYGVSGIETLPALVKRIEPGENLTANLVLTPYDPAIYTADTGTIPAFTSYLNVRVDTTAPAPPTVTLRSDSTTMLVTATSSTARLAVDITPPVGSAIPIISFEVQWRLNGSTNWGATRTVMFGTPTYFISPVQPGQVYEVRVRSKGFNGLFSDWVQPADHTIVGNSKAPAQPTNPFIVVQGNGNNVSWTNPPAADLRGVQLWQNKVNNFFGALMVGETLSGHMLHSPVYPGDTHYYWLVSVNTSGQSASPLYAGSMFTPQVNDTTGGDSYIEAPDKYGGVSGAGGGGWRLSTGMKTQLV